MLPAYYSTSIQDFCTNKFCVRFYGILVYERCFIVLYQYVNHIPYIFYGISMVYGGWYMV